MQLGHEPGNFGRVVAEHLAEHLRRQGSSGLIELLDERLVRRWRIHVEAVADQHRHLILTREVRSFFNEPALARTRLAGDEHHPAAATRRKSDELGEQLPLFRATNIRRAIRRQQGREIVRPGDQRVVRRQHARRRGASARRRLEQHPLRSGQAQRIGQQPGRILTGGQADPPLQVTDRPRGKARCLRQLLLRQPGIGPQLPQQPPETRPSLLRHGPHRPFTAPARSSHPALPGYRREPASKSTSP